jgi:anti-anti-sigma regulatory factor
METVELRVTQEGDWLPADELRRSMAEAVSVDAAIGVDLAGVEHLDARPLQVLLAFLIDRQASGKQVRLSHVSDGLARWFGYVGATTLVEPVRVDKAA